MPSATRNLFEKRFLDFQKLFIIKSFWGCRDLFSKSGRRPHPIHGQPDAVLSGHHFKKDCFFCFLLQDINKKVLTSRRQKWWWEIKRQAKILSGNIGHFTPTPNRKQWRIMLNY